MEDLNPRADREKERERERERELSPEAGALNLDLYPPKLGENTFLRKPSIVVSLS